MEVVGVKEFWLEQEHDSSWAQNMLDSWTLEHRGHVLTAISLLPQVRTLHEVGCGSGPNLRLIREEHPKMYLEGSEPRRELRRLCQETFNCVELLLPEVPKTAFDVVLSMYAMAYLPDPTKAIQNLYEAGNKHLILIEPSAEVWPFGPAGLYNGHAMPSWVHDYQGIAESVGWRTLWRWPIVPQFQGLNCTLVLSR